MNKAFRLLWSKAKERWVIVAEVIKGNGGPSPVTVAASAAISALLTLATGAQALPTGGQIAAGQATISSPTAGQMNITQSTNQAIINWNSFGIGKGEAVNIAQPNAASTLLNRVLGNNPSQIFGSLTANGKVFLVNPSGVLFAPGSSVNVGGLVASTLNIKDSDFLAGKYNFFKDGTSGSVTNQGSITGGFVALLGNSVENAGTIITTKGTTGLAAGDAITLGFDPNGYMAIKVDQAAYNAQVKNSGVIEANGGTVVMTASAADALLATVVNNSGIVKATGMVEKNGEIVIEGGTAINSGTLDASSSVGNGGSVKLLGQYVALIDHAAVDASGSTGGGTVLIGGDYQGKNQDVQNAQATYVGKDTVIKADATQTGDGGKVIVWADETTRAYGSISVKGGANSGNGGFVETSGHWLDVSGIQVATSALNGKGGSWLLDPNNITIQAAGVDTNVTASPNLTSTNDSSIITTGTIQTALNAGTSVIISTSTGGTNAQAGDITVASAISKTGGTDATLTLNAHNNINLNASITSTTGKLDLVFNPDSDSAGGGAVVLGTMTLDALGGTISAAGKTVSKTTGTATINSTMDIGTLNFIGGTLGGTGNITVTGPFNITGSNVTLAGTGTLTTQGTSTVNMATGTSLSVTGGKHWINQGTLTIGGDDYIFLGQSSYGNNVLTNAVGATLNMSSTNATPINMNTWGGTGTVNNLGTLNQTAAGTYNINGSITFNNTGTVNVTAGTLQIMGGGTDTGTYNVAAGTGIAFSGGTRNLNAGSNVTGSGSFMVGGGTVNANNLLDIVTTGSGISVWGGTLTVGTGAASGTLVPLAMTGGTVNLNAPVTLSTLSMSNATLNLNTGLAQSLSGLAINGGAKLNTSDSLNIAGALSFSGDWATLGGTGNVTVTGPISVNNNASLLGTGTFTTQGTTMIDMAGGVAYLSVTGGKTWINQGTLTIGGDDYIFLGQSSYGNNVLTNAVGSTLNMSSTNATPINMNTWGGTGTVNNLGTLNQTAAGTHNINGSITFNNTGTVNVTAGTLQIMGGGTDTGTYNVAAGTGIAFSGGTRNLNVGSNVTGNGSLLIGGTVNANNLLDIVTTGSGISIWNGTLTVGTGAASGTLVPLAMTGGTVNLNAPVTLSTLSMSNASDNATLNLNTGLSQTLSSLTMSGGSLINTSDNLSITGALTMSGNCCGNSLGGSGNITVAGQFDVTHWSTLWGSGTFTTQGNTMIDIAVGNSLSVTGGKTWINQGVLTIGGDDYIHMGNNTYGTNTLTNAVGATLNLSSTNATPINHNSGTLTVNNQGTLNQTMAGTHSISSLNTFNNTGTVNVTAGTLNIAGGFTQSGTINVASGATFQKTAGFTNTGTITGSGTIAVGTGTSKLTNNGTITPGGAGTVGTLAITGDLAMATGGSLNVDLNGAGSYDVMNVSGIATLTNGTLNLSGTGGAGAYRVINATGGLGGTTFNTINSGTFTHTTDYVTTPLTLNVTANRGEAIFWDGGAGDGLWTSLLNWSNNQLPLATNVVSIAAPGQTVTISSGNQAVNTLTSNAHLSITGGSLTLNGNSSLTGSANLTIGSGTTLTNNATLSVGGGTTLNGTLVNGILSGATLTSSTGTLDNVTIHDIDGAGGRSTSLVGTVKINNNLLLSNGVFFSLGANSLNFNGPTNSIGLAAGATSAALSLAGGTLRAGASTNATVTINNGITVQGYGTINQINFSGWVNNGTISSNTSGQTLTINSDGFTNNGTLNATAGTLNVSPIISLTLGTGSTLNISGGTLNVSPGGTWSNALGSTNFSLGVLNLYSNFTLGSLGNYSRSGGVLNIYGRLDLENSATPFDWSSSGQLGIGGLGTFGGTIANGIISGTTFNSSSGTLDNVTIGSNMTLAGTLKVSNNLLLSNGVNFDIGSNSLNFNGPANSVSLASGATNASLNMSGGFLRAGASTNATVTINNGITVQGYGAINQINYSGWVNNGTISSNTSGQTLAINSDGFTNNGTLNATAGTLNVSAISFGQSGTINVASGAIFSRTGGFSNNGTISGSGTITVGTGASKLVNQGIIAPGGTGATSMLTVSGDLQLSTGSNLKIELGGTGVGQFDKLTVNGALSGNAGSFGTLTLSKINGFTYGNSAGDTFQILSATSGANTAAFTAPSLLRNTVTPTYAASAISLNVVPMVLTVTADNLSKTYGDADPTFTYAASGFDTNTSDTAATALSGLLDRVSGSNAGSYAINLGTLISPLGYVINYTPGTFTINKAHLTVTADNKNRTYGAANPVFTTTVSGFVNGETSATAAGFAGTGTASSTADQYTNAGSATITAGAGTLSSTNYDFTNLVDGTLTIDKAHLTVTADNKNRTYGAANPVFTTTVSGFVNGETSATAAGFAGTGTASSTADQYTNAGSATITAGAGTLSSTNYDFTNLVDGTLTIDKAHLTVTADNKNRTYGAANPVFTTTVSGFVNGATSATAAGFAGTGTASSTADQYTNAGSATITAGAGTLSSTNYDFTNLVDGTLTIDKAHLTVTADNKNRTYGAANPVFTTTVSGFVNGETSATAAGFAGTGTASSTADQYTNAGSATITAGAGTLSSTNYDFTNLVDGTLTIDKAHLTIAANADSKSYDGIAYSGGNGVSYSGFVNGESSAVLTGTLAYTGTSQGATAVGSYTITPQGLSSGNYQISFTDGGLDIMAAAPPPPPPVVPPSEPAAPSSTPVEEPRSPITPEVPAIIAAPPEVVLPDAPLVISASLPVLVPAPPSETLPPAPLSESAPVSQPATPVHPVNAVAPPVSNAGSGGFIAVRPLTIEHSPATPLVYAIPEDAFSHSNPAAVISLVSLQEGCSPLPSWMLFDPDKKIISGLPPKGTKGIFRVALIAKDQFGGEAKTILKIRVGG